MSKSLSKADILAACDRKVIEVEVPEWEGSVHLRSLSLGEGLDFQAARKQLDGATDDRIVAVLLSYTLSDEAGNALFKLSEVELLHAKNPKVLGSLFEKALSLTRSSPDDRPETEEERGNE